VVKEDLMVVVVVSREATRARDLMVVESKEAMVIEEADIRLLDIEVVIVNLEVTEVEEALVASIDPIEISTAVTRTDLMTPHTLVEEEEVTERKVGYLINYLFFCEFFRILLSTLTYRLRFRRVSP